MTDPTENTDFALSALTLIQRFVGNQPDALKKMREQVETEYHFAMENAARAKAQLEAIDKIQSMIEAAPVPLPAPVVVSKVLGAPSLRKGIRQLLIDRPGVSTRDEIIEELERRGWSPGGNNPRNTVVSRLSEMTKAGVIVRKGDGYALADEKEEVPAM